MTAWIPLIKSRIPPTSEFTGLLQASAKSEFRNLNSAKSDIAADPPDTAANSPQPASEAVVCQTENPDRRTTEMRAREAQLSAEAERLHAELDRMANAHEAELKAISETLAASLLRQHENSIEALKETLATGVANVLRPILISAASDAAIRDFKHIIGELVEGADGATFSIKTSELLLERLAEVLPKQFTILPCSPDETALAINIGKEVISSRLAEWSQSIAASHADE